MTEQTTIDLIEGMPIYYNTTGNLRKWEDICLYTVRIEEELIIKPIPLSEMGYKFKRHVRGLVDFVNNINE
jgi:hypothetical protein